MDYSNITVEDITKNDLDSLRGNALWMLIVQELNHRREIIHQSLETETDPDRLASLRGEIITIKWFLSFIDTTLNVLGGKDAATE